MQQIQTGLSKHIKVSGFCVWAILFIILISPEALLVDAEPGNDKKAPLFWIEPLERESQHGKVSSTIMAGESITLGVRLEHPGEATPMVKWKIEDAFGNDHSNEFLDDPYISGPVFSTSKDKQKKSVVYMIKANTTDPDGFYSEKHVFLTVNTSGNKAPHSSITADNFGGNAPLTVNFACYSYDADGEIVSYCWDFDDSDGVNPERCDETKAETSKTFTSPGRYRVTCIVTDDKAGIGFDKRVITVDAATEPPKTSDEQIPKIRENHPPFISSFVYDYSENEKSNTVALTAQVSDEDNDNLAIRWTITGGTLSTATAPVTFWTLPSTSGKYTCRLTVSDGIADPIEHFLILSIAGEDKNQTPSPPPEDVSRGTTISVGLFPMFIAVDESRDRVFVSNSGSNTVSIIDTAKNSVIETVKTDGAPWHIASDPISGRVYTTNKNDVTINVFDGLIGAYFQEVVTGGMTPTGVAVDGINGVYYVSHSSIPSGSVIPMSTVSDTPITTIQTGSGSSAIAVNRMTRRVYVADSSNNKVTVIDGSTNSILTDIFVDPQPTDVIVNENTNYIYVSCKTSGTVAVINGTANVIMSSITVGTAPTGMGIDPVRNLIYVADNLSGTVSVIDGNSHTVKDKIVIGDDPYDVAVHSKINKIYVTLYNTGKVLVLDGIK